MKRTALARRTGLKKRNARRARKLHAEQFGDEHFQAYVRNCGCLIGWLIGDRELAGCWGPTEIAHVKSRGAGGGARNNVVGLCTTHHRLQHQAGIETFQKRLRVDLQAEAEKMTKSYDDTYGGLA